MTSKDSTILVVEDDNIIRNLVKWCLEDEGFQTETATNGIEAIDKATEQKPDLVLLDLGLPLLDGEEVAARLHQLYGDQLPIIVVSADNDAKKKARSMGATMCLAKPFDLDELVKTVRGVLAQVYKAAQNPNWKAQERPI